MTWSAIASLGVLLTWFALTLWAHVQQAKREREWEKHVTQALDLDEEQG